MPIAVAMAMALAASEPPRLDGSLAGFSSDLPVLVLDTGGARLARDPPAGGRAALWLPAADGRARLSGPPDLAGRVEVWLRGSSSLRHPKKQLVVRFADASGGDAAVPFLGMPAGSRFVLRPSYLDRSLLRDALASSLAREMGLSAPRARHAELFLASHGDAPSRADYHGVYVAMENVEVGPGRVEIDPLGPGDAAEPALTGGYLLRRDRPGPGDLVVRTRRGEALVLQDPPPARARPEQVAWIGAHLDRLEALLFSDDPADRRAARALVDVGSFVDMGLLLEVTRNADGLKTSTFFAKPRGAPLRAGPPWDFDVALGNDRIAVDPTGWQALLPREGRSPWWPRLAADVDVAQALADRYASLRRGPLADGAVSARIRALAARVAEGARRNFERWPVLGRALGPSPDAPATWEEEVASLEAWLLLRLSWLDAQWPRAPRIVRDPDGRAIVLAEEGEPLAAAGDPRAPGGEPAQGAVALEGTAPRRTVLVERAGRAARCGASETVPLRLPEGTDELAVETAAPPAVGFAVALDGAPVAARPPLPIVRPAPELGSAVRGDGLHLAFRVAAPARAGAALVVTAERASGGRRCELPALRVAALRLGRYPLPPGAAAVRVRKGERWSAPAAELAGRP